MKKKDGLKLEKILDFIVPSVWQFVSKFDNSSEVAGVRVI